MKKAIFAIAIGAAVVSTPAQAQGYGGGRDQTRAEAQQRADGMFQRLDSNHDGALTREEAQKASLQMSSGGPRVERMMARLFGDAQALTQAQFEAQALARFDRQDLNHDGTVTADERQQGRTAWQGRRDQ